MTNIECLRLYDNKRQELSIINKQACIDLQLLAGVYKSHCKSTKNVWDTKIDRSRFLAKQFYSI